MCSMLAAGRRFWAEARGYQRLAYLVGAGLILVGLAHAAIWAVMGGSASGALSWRKRTTFGLSFGLTTVTLAWVGTWLPVRPAIGWVAAGLLCAATTYEVAWVTVQHARGVPAHFSDTTPLDERLFILGAVMVAVAIGVIAANDPGRLRSHQRAGADGLGDPGRTPGTRTGRSCSASSQDGWPSRPRARVLTLDSVLHNRLRPRPVPASWFSPPGEVGRLICPGGRCRGPGPLSGSHQR